MIFNVMYRNKTLILISFSLYLMSFYLGYLLTPSKLFDKNVHTGVMNIDKNIQMEDENILPDPLSFITNNLKVVISSSLGFFSLGIITVIELLLNGLYHGIFTKIAKQSTDVFTILKLTLPHGFFELPAIWIAGASGLKSPRIIIQYLRGVDISIKNEIKEFVILLSVSVLLIIIAGIIEAYITVDLVR